MAKKKNEERPPKSTETEASEELEATATKNDGDEGEDEDDAAEARAEETGSDDDAASEDDASSDEDGDDGDASSDEDGDDAAAAEADDDAKTEASDDADGEDADGEDDEGEEPVREAKAESKKADEKKADEKKSSKEDSGKKAAAASKGDEKKSTKKADKSDKADKLKKADAKADKSDKAAAKKSDEKKKAPADEDAVSEDLRTLFGLQASNDKGEDPSDYEPDERTGASVGSVLGLIVIAAAVVGLIVGAVQILKKRQDEIDEAYKKRKAEAEAIVTPEIRYGNIALLASEPPRALVLQNGSPVYVRTPDGAYTELRVAPDTRIQNVKIEEGVVVRYTLESEGFKPYEIALDEFSWAAVPGSEDLEKVYTKIRLEPIEERLLPNCEEIQALGAGFANACLVGKSDEVLTRKDFERIYVDPTTEQPVLLTGTMTIESEPQGAKIFFNSRPLLTPDGNQAVTPYTFSEYKLGAPAGGAAAEEAPAPTDGQAAATPAPADAIKKVSVTGFDSDSRLSVRLELDGKAPYRTAIYPHSWKCTPTTDVKAIQAMARPKKSDPTAADMLHDLCEYSYRISGKLLDPPTDDDKKGGDTAAAEPAKAP